MSVKRAHSPMMREVGGRQSSQKALGHAAQRKIMLPACDVVLPQTEQSWCVHWYLPESQGWRITGIG